jgi:hypothetical protein
VDAGTISFMPDPESGTRGPMSQADIGSDGSYELIAPGNRKGAVLGTHIVMVESPEISSAGGPEPTVVVPKRYNSDETSGIKKEVQEGDNVIHIELTSE